MIINIWSVLEFLIDQNVQRDSTPGTAVTRSLQDVIRGYEFKAIVEGRFPCQQKKAIRNTSGGRPALVQDIDALVLFANGYEDVTRPLKDNSMDICNVWQSESKRKDYLVMTIKILKDLYDVASSRPTRSSTYLQWHRGDTSLFEPRETPGAHRRRYNRLQKIVPNQLLAK